MCINWDRSPKSLPTLLIRLSYIDSVIKTCRLLQSNQNRQKNKTGSTNAKIDPNINHLAPQQSLHYTGSNILRILFLDSSNIFSDEGFGSNHRAYVGILQQGIMNDFDALSAINLKDLSPVDAWF